MTSVCTAEPWVKGFTPAAKPSGLVCTIISSPSSRARRSRKAIMSRNFQPVSMCRNGKGGRAGWKAFIARCIITDESLPIEYIITGLRNWAATSRMMWMLSASSCCRWLSCR